MTVRAKIIFVVDKDSGYFDDFDSLVVTSTVTDGLAWEEISEKDFDFLRKNLHLLDCEDARPVLIRESSHSIPESVSEVTKILRERQEEIERKERERKQKRQKAAERNREKEAKKKRELLEKLKKELGESQ